MSVTKVNGQKIQDRLQEISISGFCLVFYSIFVYINSQNVIGSQSLFMDEKLIYDGVNSILNPESLSTLSYAILDGGDQRYGRLLWNTIAVFSFIPNLIWGSSAIIFVERMIGATAILVSYLILTRLFVKKLLAQATLLVILFILPFSVYYATTPKPEPLMLLSLSVYLQLSFKKMRFFGPHWIFLGLVLGLKISGIFIVAAVCFYMFIQILRSRILPNATDVIKSTAFFLIGIALTIPTLFFLGILGLLFYTFSNLRFAKASLSTMKLFLLGALGLSFERSIDYFRNYFAWTINSANHPSDSDEVTPLSWTNFIFERYLNSSISSLFFLVLLFALTNLAYRVKKDSESSAKILVAILVFFFTITPVVLLVERLWGFYLWVGFIFLACAFVKNTQIAMSTASKAGKMTLIAVVILFISSLNLHTSFTSEVRTSSAIEASEGFLLQQKRFNEITGILNQLSSKNESKLRVAYDPILWVPNSTNRYEINVFWGPFTDWKSGFDLVVMTSSHLQKEIDFSSSDSSLRILEVEGFKNHVIAAEEECRVEKCYSVFADFDGVTILKSNQ